MKKKKMAEEAARAVTAVREKKPLVHNITNYVVMNYTANALLACGASPVMAHAVEEVEEMVSLASALVINIGTLSAPWCEAMMKAGKKANELGIPVVLDPVGAGATAMRTRWAKKLIEELSIRVVRGNASEILALAPSRRKGRTKGVDSVHTVEQAAEAAVSLARTLRVTLAITGAVDLVTDGRRVLRVKNGHEMMASITGSGCTASAITGAFLAVTADPVDAAASALAYFGLAGELAAQLAGGPGTFQVALLDALYSLRQDHVRNGARIEG